MCETNTFVKNNISQVIINFISFSKFIILYLKTCNRKLPKTYKITSIANTDCLIVIKRKNRP